MRSLQHLRGRRLLGVLAALAVVAVAIPAASGYARAGSKAQFRASAVVKASVLRKAEGKPKGHGPKPGKGYTCTDGSIPPGTYDSLTVAGQCAVDEGVVKVKHNVTVQPNAGLFAAFGNGPQLAIGGNLNVKSNATLILGCLPYGQPCFNDPDQEVGSLTSKGTVGGNLHTDGAFLVDVHDTYIGHDYSVHGGGGGVNCDTAGFYTVEDSVVGHNATVDGLQTCWSGFFRTNVGGKFKYNNNTTADPDGNEIQTNVVQRNMDCNGNDPVVQAGDSGGFPDVVFGHATGQCAAIVGP